MLRPKAAPNHPRIAIVAPSGPIERPRFEKGLKKLTRLLGEASVRVPSNLGAVECGMFAGPDHERLGELQAVLADPEIDVVIAARGGSGMTRLLDRLDPEVLRAAPKILVGFSDISGLLAWSLRQVSMTSIHGPVVTQMSTLPDDAIVRLQEMIAGEVPPVIEAEEGTVVQGGSVEGPLFAANLEVLRCLIGTKSMPDLRGYILALEEIGERPYRLDRSLTHLMSSGALRGVRGIAIGQLIGCEEPEDRVLRPPRAEQVVADRLADLRIPVVTGFGFGHDHRQNQALPVGTMARLDADNGALAFYEPVCS
ncbi:MAG: S66 peptidase family protein [Nannocystaceae bacterium]